MTAPSPLHAALDERILILDCAMGTMIQSYSLDERDYRGERFADWASDLKGNNDLLCLTQPDIITAIHDANFAAGADIVETNTFNANFISQADYGMESLARELNVQAARLARTSADAWTARDPQRPRWVAGALGPTNRTASVSPDVNDPGFRNVQFEELVAAYTEALDGLVEGGIDIVLVETIFDTLNAKAALYAIARYFEGRTPLPVMISGTITDASGRTLSGQTTEAFYHSVSHAAPLSVGLNCALGAHELRQYVEDLSRVATCAVSAYPNAGLPNEFGEYDDSPESMAAQLGEWARSGGLLSSSACSSSTRARIACATAACASGESGGRSVSRRTVSST